jgi:hypothetical protein
MPADSYTNNRRDGWDYDLDGNLLVSADAAYTYDAAGEMRTAGTYEPQSTTTRGLDGDGQQLKTVESTYQEATQSWTTTTTYYLPSSVLGGNVLTELSANGAKTRTFVYASGRVLATQKFYGANEAVEWEHRDPSNASFRVTQIGGSVAQYAELDPTNADAGVHAPLISPSPPDESGSSLVPYPSFSNPRSPGTVYMVAGIRVSLDFFLRSLDTASNSPYDLMRRADAASKPTLRNYEIDYGEGPKQDFGRNGWGAFVTALRLRDVTLVRNYIVGTDWNFFAALLPQDPNLPKINHAFGDAAQAIAPTKGKKKDPCKDFFTKGRTLQQVTEIFRAFWNTVNSNPSSAHAIAGTVNSGQEMSARLNLHAPFFAEDDTTEAGKLAGYSWAPSRKRYEELFTSLTPRQYRAMVILHEFAHALGLIPSDKDLKNQSQKNDEIIFEHCGDALNRLPAQ